MSNLKKHVYLLIPLSILCVLLLRNPFSLRTLIPNFEPFPDSFHYIVPVRCFLAGEGWGLCREGKLLTPAVPPLYSLTLLPFFALSPDPRMFYFANVVLTLASFGVLVLILRQLNINRLHSSFVLLLYVINYYTYWLPTLAMAEHLLILVFLLAIWLLLLPVTYLTVIAAAFITVAFYATKYAAAPLSAVYGLSYGLYLLSSTLKKHSFSWKLFFSYSTLVHATTYVLFGITFTFLLVGSQVFKALDHFEYFITPTQSLAQPATTEPTFSFFSTRYVSAHLPQYLSIFIGKSIRFLWSYTPLFSLSLGLVGLAGWLWALTRQRYRFLAITVIGLCLAQILFMSTFYSLDARYVYILLPSVLIGVGLFLEQGWHTNWAKAHRKLVMGLIIGVYLLTLGLQAVTLKYQIMLNLRYAETPWWYLATQELNTYFATHPSNTPVYVATLISPYYLDFFGNDLYRPLPLWHEQDFRGNKEVVWGIPQTETLPETYERLLKEGNSVYLFTFGLHVFAGSDEYRTQLIEQFHAKPVFTSCAETCTLYTLSL